jgi:putative tricarboxylic transport membrane protein
LKLSLSKDGWGGLAVLAASLVLFALTFGLRDSPLVPIGPGFYPRIVLGLTALFAAALVAFDLLRKKTAAPRGSATYGAVLLHFAVFGIYAVTLPWIGFRIGTFAYVAATNALLDAPRSARGWLRVALLALGTVLATYYMFEHYLLVLLPRGRWTGF